MRIVFSRLRQLAVGRMPYGAGPLVVLILNAAIALNGRPSAGQVYYRSGFYYDAQFYVGMSRLPVKLPLACVGPPYCWRVLAPWVAHLIPGSPSTEFQLLTVVSLALTCLAMSWILRGVGLDRGAAAWGGVAFATLGPATGFSLFDVARIDSLAFLLLALVVGATLHRRWRTGAALLVLVAFAKETVLLGIVFQLRRALRTHGPYAWVLLGAAGAIAVFVVLRLEIRLPAGVHNPFLDQVGTVTHYTIFMPRSLPRALSATVGTWGFLTPLAALQLVHRPRLWRRPEFTYLLLVAMGQVFVSGDVQRVVVYAFPAMIVAAALEVDYLSRRIGWPRWAIWGPVIAAQLLWSIPADLGAGFSPPDTITSDLVTSAVDIALAVATVLAVLVLRGMDRKDPPLATEP